MSQQSTRPAAPGPTSAPGPGQAPSRPRPDVSLWQLGLTFLRIGIAGFGAWMGMLALMREEVVRRKQWVTDEQLGVAVAMGQMLPGPFIANYAQYVGYELRGLRGMTLAVVAMLLPSFLLMVGLSWFYARFGTVPTVTNLFAGIQPVVVAILLWATVSIGRTQVRSRRAGLVAVLAFIALWFRIDALLVVLGAGLLGLLFSGAWRRRPGSAAFWPWLLPAAIAAPALPLGRAFELTYVFLKIGAVIFGGGFAAIPFIQQEVVDVRGWLTVTEFLDGLAISQLTPGPVVKVSAFVGFRVLGLPGALLATVAVFLPSYLLLLGLIQVYRRVKDNPLVTGFLSGVMPAVTGMLLSAAFFLGRTAIYSPAAAMVGLLSLALLLRFRIAPVWLVLGGALFGLLNV